jgi:ABC-type phosphate transport system substrate-binding protein
MKFSKISLGVAAVFGIMASPAHAILASSYINASEFAGDTQNIRISGATAQDQGILAASLRLCTAGTMTAYSINNNFVYFCDADGTKFTRRSGATKLAVYKYSVGGSGAGVGFVNNATPIPFLDLTKLATLCSDTSTTVMATKDADGTATNLSTYTLFSCTAASSSLTTNAVSYMGVSDVEPQFFGPPSTYSKLNASSLATVIFGVPVSKAAYEKLQTAQGLTVGSVTEANMPSLTQAQITTMFTQEGQTWANVTGVEVNAADDLIYVARRVDSSGTQKTFEAVVAKTLNGTSGARQCASDVDSFVSGTVAADNTAANTICNDGTITMNGSGSSQVLVCLNKHNDFGRGAVGVTSTESKQVDVGGKWRFVKINGAAPTHANVAAGKYTQYSDASLNLRTGAILPTLSAAGYSDFVTAFKTAFADPVTISVINGGSQTFGPSGLMALDALVSPVPTPDFTGASGRNPWSRLVGNTDLNNCQSGKLAQ